MLKQSNTSSPTAAPQSPLADQPALANFLSQLRAAPQRLLLLDYDGTLAPFQPDPATALPYPGVADALRELQADRTTTIAAVSGRQAREVAQLLGVDGIEVWGCHGLEHLLPDGSLQRTELDSATRAQLHTSRTLLQQAGLEPQLEPKPTGYAIHWRGRAAEDAHQLKSSTLAVWDSLLQRDRLRLLHFDGGLEICAAAGNKGDAVCTMAARLNDHAALAYLGDDTTDEDAFLALPPLRPRLCGLGVLVRPQWRATAAELWLQPPQGVLEFLNLWRSACQTSQ